MGITEDDYFAPKEREANPEITPEVRATASVMLGRVNGLLNEARWEGVYADAICPNTDSAISGSHLTPPSGDGGFRLSTSKTGGPSSQHRKAHAVDVYDPFNALDRWIDMFEGEGGKNSKLEEHGLYREAPAATPGWCHLQDVAPGSGRHTFNP